MVIERNGRQIALTPSEMLEAYYEQERNCLEADASEMLWWMREDGEISQAEYERYIDSDSNAIDKIVDMYLDRRDCNVPFNDTMRFAIDEVLRNDKGKDSVFEIPVN